DSVGELQTPNVEPSAIKPLRSQNRIVGKALGAGRKAQQPERRAPPPQRRRRGQDAQLILADPRATEWQWRRRPAIAPGELGLVGNPAMLDAIGESGICGLSAEIEV